jgi:hypothetical protein
MGHQMACMEDKMNAMTVTITPAEQVDELIQKVAVENSLELSEAFSQASPVGKKTPLLKIQDQPEKDDLEAWLANLRNTYMTLISVLYTEVLQKYMIFFVI